MNAGTPEPSTLTKGQRGPSEHANRSRILNAANSRFKNFGYEKTRVSQIARDIGISKAYIYKLFESKQALGDAVCRDRLTEILQHLDECVAAEKTASGKLRKLYAILVSDSVQSFFSDRTLYEICAISALDQWPSTVEFIAGVEDRLTAILQMGREVGEFERKTPLADVRSAIGRATMSLTHPMMLQYQLDDAQAAIVEVTTLILRSMAP